jgi:hypothetical protein
MGNILSAAQFMLWKANELHRAILNLKELHAYIELSLRSDPNFEADSDFLDWLDVL